MGDAPREQEVQEKALPAKYMRKKLGNAFGLLPTLCALVFGFLFVLGFIGRPAVDRWEYETEEWVADAPPAPPPGGRVLEVKAPGTTRQPVRIIHHFHRSGWDRRDVSGAILIVLGLLGLCLNLWNFITPYVRIWRDGMKVFISPWRTERVYWSSVESVDFRGDKAVFGLPGKDTLEIPFGPLAPASRKELQETIRGLLRNKGARGA